MPNQEHKVDSNVVAIRRATKNEPWSAITALLHRAYAVHAARGLRFYASYQDENVTRERADEGECYLALIDSVVVGTVTALPGGRKSECSCYARADVASMGQLAVDPAFQHRGIGTSLMDLAEKRAREWGARQIAIDTSEHATDLITLYSKRGCKIVDSISWPVTNDRSVILAKPLQPHHDHAQATHLQVLRTGRQRRTSGNHRRGPRQTRTLGIDAIAR